MLHTFRGTGSRVLGAVRDAGHSRICAGPVGARDERGRVAVAGCEGSGAMGYELRVGPASELPPSRVVRAGRYAVGNATGTLFAVGRHCRHLGADLAGGSIDEDGCLVCPWHASKYDVGTGRMVR